MGPVGQLGVDYRAHISCRFTWLYL